MDDMDENGNLATDDKSVVANTPGGFVTKAFDRNGSKAWQQIWYGEKRLDDVRAVYQQSL